MNCLLIFYTITLKFHLHFAHALLFTSAHMSTAATLIQMPTRKLCDDGIHYSHATHLFAGILLFCFNAPFFIITELLNVYTYEYVNMC